MERYLTPGELLEPLLARRKAILLSTMAAGLLGFAGSYLVKPSFSSTTTFIPPQQQQSAAASAMASLGALAGVVGGSSIKSPADQYVALMQSATVSDRMVDSFQLMTVYDVELRTDARRELASRVQITAGKKDGLIAVTVEDHDNQRAAEMANRYVDELRRMTSILAVSEAQQRRAFFEGQLELTKTRLTKAQILLQESGVGPGMIKAEPKAAAEGFAKLKAELTTAEIRLQVLRSTLSNSATEVIQQSTAVNSLRSQLDSLQNTQASTGPDYISRYREYKYQEALFDMMAKQYELARIDESREGSLVQVVDIATPAEKKSRPSRLMFALVAAICAAIAIMLRTLLKTFGPASLA